MSAIPAFTPEPYTPSDRETTWGFGLGGQIRHSKLFWFAALDSYQRNDPGVSMVKHPDNFFAQPSNDQMQVLSARLGLSSANPVAAGVAAYSSSAGNARWIAWPGRAHGLAMDRLWAHWTGLQRSGTASLWKEPKRSRTHPEAE